MNQFLHQKEAFHPLDRASIEQSIFHRFEQQVAKAPHQLAIKTHEHHLTYDQVNKAANRLARLILAQRGEGHELIPILFEHGAMMIVAMLGVLKAGKGWVPIDPWYPLARIRHILNTSEAALLVTNRRNLPVVQEAVDSQYSVINLDEIEHSLPDENLNLSVSPDTIACVLPTSGSTGEPKGVIHNHRNFLHTCMRWTNAFRICPDDRLLLLNSYCHIGGINNILSALLNGATSYPFALKEKDLTDLAHWLMREEITVYHSVSTVFRHLIDSLSSEGFPQLRLIHLGGEPVSKQDFELYKKSFAQHCIFLNSFGCTELSSYRQYFIDKSTQIEGHIIPVGYAAEDTEVLLLDETGEVVGQDGIGEIVVKSPYLALGYWKRPDLDALSFLDDPMGSNQRLYRTGDLGKMLPDGCLIHLGRKDLQVQIRGYRVEVSECEAVLTEHPQVKEAAVTAWDHVQGEKALVAYVVSYPNYTPDSSELKDFLAQKLPSYMVPAHFVFLDALPLNANGKIDRKGLPKPNFSDSHLSTIYIAPQTPLEEHLSHIWAQVLKLNQVGIYDNFFELGGHSLLATQVISRIQEALKIDLPLRYLFENPTIADLAQHAETLQISAQDSILPISRNQTLPLSFAQQRLWFLDQLEPGSTVYNLPAVYQLSGLLNLSALEHSLQEIIRRHEALRTIFQSQDDQPQQVITPPDAFCLPVVDLSAATEQKATVQRYVAEETQHVFNLAAESLVRAKLLKLSDREYVLVVTMHHIVSDGWSMGIFRRELTTLYQAFANHQPSPLPELSIQYADFAHWQRQWLSGEVLESQLNYWRTQLKDAPPVLELPTDYPRPPQSSYRGNRQAIIIPPALVKALQQLSQQEGVTLFMTLLAAFTTLLYRYSGQEDVVIGSPIANRNRVETEDLIGFFVNTLVLRTDLSGTPSFRHLLQRVRETTLGAYAHQDIPFEKLVEELKPERNQAYSPLFQVMFALQNTPTTTLELPDLQISLQDTYGGTAMFDLTLELKETPQGLQGYLEYSRDLFADATIERMVGHFQTLLQGIVAAPDQSIATQPILTEAEQQQLFVEWNQTQIDYPKDQCIHQVFEARAEQSPDAIAVIFEDQQLTYRELKDRANVLAAYLTTLGVTSESLVGICIERSVEMMVGILGILKSGAAYVPLDPSYPQERLAFILSDSQVTVLITQKHLTSILPKHNAQVICLDEDWNTIVTTERPAFTVNSAPDHLAYIIYTSGSTGKPKGVMIPHRALVNFVTAAATAYELTENDRILQFASISFDAAIEEIFCCLSYGATLILRTDELLGSVSKLLQKCTDWKLTVLDLPTAYWHQLISELATNQLVLPPSVRLVIIGGERVLPEKVKLWQTYIGTYPKLVNSYGPTEATVVATTAQIHASNPDCDAEFANLPIGRPLGNVQLYVLDQFLQPVPIGIPGELHIGGLGLAKGYLNRPDLAAEKFIAHPFSNTSSDRLYKTGDLVRYRPDGNLEFLGRIDNQVKIRGFRIELGEIETALTQHPAIEQAIVIVREDVPGDKRLVAYVVMAATEDLSNSDLRSFLKQALPDYMIPAVFVRLESFPLTPNNKIDYRALPQSEAQDLRSDDALVAPQDDLETQLVALWEKLLGIHPISITDNFFDLGGHSLLAVRLFNDIEKTFGKHLPLATLFQAATIQDLAQIIRQQNWLAPWNSLVPMQPLGSKPPLFYLHAGGGNLLVYRDLAYSFGSDQPVYGLQPKGLDGKFDPFQTIEDMADYYLAQILKVQPQGPYFLAGLSSGGTTALEIAQRLHAKGEKVALLALFDTVGPDYYQILPLLPRIASVLGWVAADWYRRFSTFPLKLLRIAFSNGWRKAYRILVERIGLVPATLDDDTQIQRLRTRSVMETEIQDYQVQVDHWLDKGVNTLLITLLKHSSNPLYAGVFARGASRQRTEVISESLYQVQEATRRATDAYRPQPYPGTLTYFQAGEQPPGIRPDPKGGWGKIAQGGIEVFTIPGNHTTMMQSPILADILKNCLDRAQTNSQPPT